MTMPPGFTSVVLAPAMVATGAAFPFAPAAYTVTEFAVTLVT